MVNGLMIGLATMLGASAELPNTHTVQAEVETFKSVYESSQASVVRVNEIKRDNPSPFLTAASSRRCSIYINENSDSRYIWSYLLKADGVPTKAFTAFAVGHEMAHCIAALPGKRSFIRSSMERQMRTSFTDNHHFEETFGDLLGLAYVKARFPQYEKRVRAQVKQVRMDLASRDPKHDSSPFLHSHWVDLSVQLMRGQDRDSVAQSGPAPTTSSLISPVSK